MWGGSGGLGWDKLGSSRRNGLGLRWGQDHDPGFAQPVSAHWDVPKLRKRTKKEQRSKELQEGAQAFQKAARAAAEDEVKKTLKFALKGFLADYLERKANSTVAPLPYSQC